jgi:hypothetical protein
VAAHGRPLCFSRHESEESHDMPRLMMPHGWGRVPGDLAAQAQRLAENAGYGTLLYFRGHGVW